MFIGIFSRFSRRISGRFVHRAALMAFEKQRTSILQILHTASEYQFSGTNFHKNITNPIINWPGEICEDMTDLLCSIQKWRVPYRESRGLPAKKPKVPSRFISTDSLCAWPSRKIQISSKLNLGFNLQFFCGIILISFWMVQTFLVQKVVHFLIETRILTVLICFNIVWRSILSNWNGIRRCMC